MGSSLKECVLLDDHAGPHMTRQEMTDYIANLVEIVLELYDRCDVRDAYIAELEQIIWQIVGRKHAL